MLVSNIHRVINGEITAHKASKVCKWCHQPRTRADFSTVKAWFFFRDTGLCETCQDQHNTGETVPQKAKAIKEG